MAIEGLVRKRAGQVWPEMAIEGSVGAQKDWPSGDAGGPGDAGPIFLFAGDAGDARNPTCVLHSLWHVETGGWVAPGGIPLRIQRQGYGMLKLVGV